MIKHNLVLLFFAFLSMGIGAQETIKYSGVVQNDSIKGLKKIMLSPKLRSVANTDFGDLRILNEAGQQTPYFIEKSKTQVKDADVFISVDKEISNKSKSTEVIINNASKKIYNSFTFLLSNTAAQKKCKIEGRNATDRWYVISEKIELNLYRTNKLGSNYFSINFPSIDYEQIRVVINDSFSAPIHIKDIGHFKTRELHNQTTYLPLVYASTIEQIGKKTLITVKANRAYQVNKIKFDVKKTLLYDRKATIYVGTGLASKRELKNININSKTLNTFDALNIKAKQFWIEIDNKDNLPLEFGPISVSQKAVYLVADLLPNQKYTIITGDKDLVKPVYDLANFTSDFTKSFSMVKINNENISTTKKAVVGPEIYETAWFMWCCIAIVALVVVLFTLSLLKKTKAM